MGLWPLEICLLLQCGDRLESSESDVYRRQILTTKVDPRALRVRTWPRLVRSSIVWLESVTWQLYDGMFRWFVTQPLQSLGSTYSDGWVSTPPPFSQRHTLFLCGFIVGRTIEPALSKCMCWLGSIYPTNKQKRWNNVILILAHHLRRWLNINPTVHQRFLIV